MGNPAGKTRSPVPATDVTALNRWARRGSSGSMVSPQRLWNDELAFEALYDWLHRPASAGEGQREFVPAGSFLTRDHRFASGALLPGAYRPTERSTLDRSLTER
jgi:hypothetical protein